MSDEVREIWKYALDVYKPMGSRVLMMPQGAQVLAVGTQPDREGADHEEGVLWAYVRPAAPKVKRGFLILMTGQQIVADLTDWGGLVYPLDEGDAGRKHVGTFQVGQYVYHVFEMGYV